MLLKYESIENRYLVFESASAYMCIPHLVDLFGLYVINDILPLNLITGSSTKIALSGMKYCLYLKSAYNC